MRKRIAYLIDRYHTKKYVLKRDTITFTTLLGKLDETAHESPAR